MAPSSVKTEKCNRVEFKLHVRAAGHGQLYFHNLLRAHKNWAAGRSWPAGLGLDAPVLDQPACYLMRVGPSDSQLLSFQHWKLAVAF